MHKARLALTLTGVAVTFITGSVAAEPYKWCANYGWQGGTNCGFVTLEQCQANVRGIGGFCRINGFYTGPEERPVRNTRKRHND
jgi:hypothetical protein